MESPPSFSTHSEAPLLSEDSGLIITSGSFSSDSVSGLLHIQSESQESDCDEKSLSQYDLQDVSGHIMCGENFNTVKKGPAKVIIPAIEPPLEFQDSPKFTKRTSKELEHESVEIVLPEGSQTSMSRLRNVNNDAANLENNSDWRHSMRQYTCPLLLHLSPCHNGVRPASRCSLQTLRRSSSHNSLTTQTEADDSSFITQAISHDTLSIGTSDISDLYNVPYDSDIYRLPIDYVRPSHKSRLHRNTVQSSFRNTVRTIYTNVVENIPLPPRAPISKNCLRHDIIKLKGSRYHGFAQRASYHCEDLNKPSNMITEINTNSSEIKSTINPPGRNSKKVAHSNNSNNMNNNNASFNSLEENLNNCSDENLESNNNLRKTKKHMFTIKNNKKAKESNAKDSNDEAKSDVLKLDASKSGLTKKSPVKSLSLNLKQTICNIFKLKKLNSVEFSDEDAAGCSQDSAQPTANVAHRALPSVPQTPNTRPRQKSPENDSLLDFPTSIQIVKDYGWYWGPISVEASERLLSVEPDGSFILRDSSDDHYIFTISFKLNGGVRHVRIEHDQGKFCFGSCTMFKARTIVEFIENAVENSQSGRYLFFLNLRPILGPVRVQLLYPVSRFTRIQSLQHMCRFVILKCVRRDLLDKLCLPRRLIDYLSTPQYYSEILSDS